MYAAAADVLAETAELLRPERRMSPTAAASKYLANERGAWSLELTPMMREPLDMLGSRDYRGIVFVGPARTGKTYALIHGAICYGITCAPGDMLVIQMSQDAARDFSRTEVDRVIRHSPELAASLSPRPRDDNTHEKYFRKGNVLKIGWPVITQLASRTVQTVLLTDYDRPENRDNVDGEGPLWDLAWKRTETYMSKGKCLAESSPGEDFVMADWHPSTPHEAPPARGILSLYNAGTRARWVWPCKHCGEYFEAAPGIEAFGVPDFDEIVKLVGSHDLHTLAERYARVGCKKCGGLHEQEDRPALNRGGVWLHEGESISAAGEVTGFRRRAQIASYWLGGAAAVFQRWDALLYRYFGAVANFARLGDESQLRTVTNTDLGAAYLPRSVIKRRSGRELRARAEKWAQGTVPPGVRFLTAAVDVQAHRFVIQVHGWGVQMESWLLDRFSISSSKRREGERYAALDPAAYLEDWDVLREAMIGRSYPLEAYPNRRLSVRLTVCDSGGREGVSARAYDFWRGLKRDGHSHQLGLIKGVGTPDAPRVKRSFPDSTGRRDRRQGGRGDVPVFLLNVNVLKDGVANDLARDTPGPGYVHLPNWLEPEIFDELTSEVRTDKGWMRPGGVRNEGFDLAVYNRAAAILLQGERINWDKPPSWAADPALTPNNPEVPATPPPVRPRDPLLTPRRRNWTTQWK